jgi:3-oxoadipate enol-lactonase
MLDSHRPIVHPWAGDHARGTIADVESMVPVDGGEIWADDSGGDGTALVLLHPGWGNADIWLPMLQRLPPGYRVIRYDARGYGRSPAPSAPFTQLGDLIAVVEHAGIEHVVPVAHSGGGGTALGLALTDPGRVRSMILLAPGVQDYPWPEDDPYFARFNALYSAGDREGLTALGLRTWAAAGGGPDATEQVRSAVAGFFGEGGFLRPDPPAYGRLGEIGVPTVVATGDRDYPMVIECGQSIAARIPASRHILVPGADHLLPLRAPSLLLELIAQYAPLGGN